MELLIVLQNIAAISLLSVLTAALLAAKRALRRGRI